MGLSTAPTCRIFPSVACSSVRCMDDWIVHFSSSSMDNVHGRLHCSLKTTSTDDLIIVQGGPRQLYTIFLCKETLLVSLVMIPDIVHSWSWTIPMDELETKQISQYPINIHFKDEYLFFNLKNSYSNVRTNLCNKDITKWPNWYYTWITIPLQGLLQHTKRNFKSFSLPNNIILTIP